MILAIDTSAAIAVAVVRGEEVLARRAEYAPRGHAELLAGMVDACLADAGSRGTDVAEVVVGTGPAPFTGLRVGLVTARTLAYVWGVPVSGVCSLDALAWGTPGDVTAVTDARRREVYWATYRDGARVAGPHVGAAADVEISGQVVGRGATLYPDAFDDSIERDPDPVALARIVVAHRAAGERDFPVEPLYLRRPDVHGVTGA